MSGIFGQLLGSVLGGGEAEQPALIGNILHDVLGGQAGGIAGLIAKFDDAGLGDTVRSWVGSGANAPISAEQLAQVLPADKLQGWAAQAGTTPEALLGMLSKALPHAVDHVTPDGEVPAPSTDIAGMLGRFLGR